MISSISSHTTAAISATVSTANNTAQTKRADVVNNRFIDTFESSDGRVATRNATKPDDQKEYREVFHKFVGETLFAQMLKTMRASQQPLPYIGGGRAEEIFQGQLDQVLVEKLTAGTPDSLSDTMFRLMNARQKMPQG